MNDVRCHTDLKRDPIRVLLVEDETIVREALCALLVQEEDITVVGAAVIKALLRAAPAVRVLILTAFAEEHEVAAAFRAGAVGYVLKTQAITELVQAIHATYQGQAALHPMIARRLLDALHPPSQPSLAGQPLSKAERLVLALVAQGLADKEIARTLGVTPTTARTHVSSILRKLQLTNRTQATLYALQRGLATLAAPQITQSGQRPSHAQ